MTDVRQSGERPSDADDADVIALDLNRAVRHVRDPDDAGEAAQANVGPP
jgi:hypothetical protein